MKEEFDYDMKTEEKYIIENFENETKKKVKIVDLLNKMSSIILNEYYQKLEIKDDEKLIIFDLAKAKLDLLEQSLEEKDENSASRLAITVFRNIFMAFNDFNLEKLEDNIYSFELILSMLGNEGIKEEEKKKIENLIKNLMNNKNVNYKAFINIISTDFNYSYSIFCFLLLLNNPCSNEVFINEFLSLIKRVYKTKNNNVNLEITKKYKESELEELSLINVVNDLSSLFCDIGTLNNFLNIEIKDKHLVINLMGYEETSNLINKEDNKNFVSGKINEQRVEQKKKLKVEEKEDKEDKDFKCKNDDKKEVNRTEKDKKKSDFKILEERINQINQINEGFQKELEKIKNKNKKLERAVKNSKINYENLNNKFLRLDSELNKIKLRDSLKGLIDFLCKAFQLETEESYYYKVLLLKKELKKKEMKNLTELGLNDFLDKIYILIKYANRSAHSIDISKPILEQIFKYIDPKNNFKKLEDLLMKGKMNELLETLSQINISGKTVKQISKKKDEILASVKGIGDIFVSE